jgi:hypothetical protein
MLGKGRRLVLRLDIDFAMRRLVRREINVWYYSVVSPRSWLFR